MLLNDLASLTGCPRTVQLGGSPYKVHPLTVEDLGTLQDWVDRQFPDPFDTANREIDRGRLVLDAQGKPAREPYSVAQQQYLLRVAMEQREKGTRLIGTPEADAKLHSMEGLKQLLLVSIRKGDPGFGEADADALYRKMGVGDIAQLVILTNLAMVTSDPKDPTPSGTETTTATGQAGESPAWTGGA
jgi:hypothetical protein